LGRTLPAPIGRGDWFRRLVVREADGGVGGGTAASAYEARKVGDPVLVGPYHQVRGPAAADGGRGLGSVPLSGPPVRLTQWCGGGDLPLTSRLRIGQGEHPDLGQCELARVDDLDDDHVVPSRHPSQRGFPLERARDLAARVDQVGDDHPQPGTALSAGHGLDRGTEWVGNLVFDFG